MASKIILKKLKNNNDSELLINNKRSQITIFIILGLIVIVIIALIFILRAPPKVKIFDENEPQAFIESCTREFSLEAIRLIGLQGGDTAPKGSITYQNVERTYLCYNNKYFEPCINQRPLLMKHVENQITAYIEPLLIKCFNELVINFEKRYDVSLNSEMMIKTTLQPKNVFVEIFRKLDVTRAGETRSYKKFQMHLNHPIYDLSEIAMEIVNQETKFCNFDTIGFMILNPGFDVTKFITGDSNIIYKITERATNEQLTFAVRGCVLPPNF